MCQISHDEALPVTTLTDIADMLKKSKETNFKREH